MTEGFDHCRHAGRVGRALLLAALAAVAACGQGGAPEGGAIERDPLLAQALADSLMTDPELASISTAAAALEVTQGHILPPIDASPEERAMALRQAGERIGGSSRIRRPAKLADFEGRAGDAPEPILLERALDGGLAPQCLARLGQSAIWAARMPSDVPVYPRAAVRDAAGLDADGCRMRLVAFATPVAVEDVAAFYYTLARQNGYRVQLEVGEEVTLRATHGVRQFVLYLRPDSAGLTMADIVLVDG